MTIEITQDFCFSTMLNKATVTDFRDATTYYITNLTDALALTGTVPLVLDTNVLLNELSLTSGERDSFSHILSEKPKRVIIPHQVQVEYNRYKDIVPEPFDSSPFSQLKPLSEAELSHLRSDFDNLRDSLSTPQFDKSLHAFPGMGDIKGKPTNPYGDYIIFHEMLKYMKSHDTDIIFLTNDLFKQDWLTSDFLAHLHYVETTFLSTGRAMYILPAGRFIRQFIGKMAAPRPEVYVNPTQFYKARYHAMWADLQHCLKSKKLNKCQTKTIHQLRRIKAILTLTEDIRHNSYLNDSWLFTIESLINDS